MEKTGNWTKLHIYQYFMISTFLEQELSESACQFLVWPWYPFLFVHSVGNMKYTHCQLFVLHCTTTWHQPGLSRGFIHKILYKKMATTEENRHTAVFIELLPQLKIVIINQFFHLRKSSYIINTRSCLPAQSI